MTGFGGPGPYPEQPSATEFLNENAGAGALGDDDGWSTANGVGLDESCDRRYLTELVMFNFKKAVATSHCIW
jgi:hypothetical protein